MQQLNSPQQVSRIPLAFLQPSKKLMLRKEIIAHTLSNLRIWSLSNKELRKETGTNKTIRCLKLIFLALWKNRCSHYPNNSRKLKQGSRIYIWVISKLVTWSGKEHWPKWELLIINRLVAYSVWRQFQDKRWNIEWNHLFDPWKYRCFLITQILPKYTE